MPETCTQLGLFENGESCIDKELLDTMIGMSVFQLESFCNQLNVDFYPATVVDGNISIKSNNRFGPSVDYFVNKGKCTGYIYQNNDQVNPITILSSNFRLAKDV